MDSAIDPAPKTIGLVLVGGEHHILHLIPITAELQKFKNLRVIIFVMTAQERAACETVLDKLGAEQVTIKVLEANRLATRLSKKLAFLLLHLKHWQALDAMLVVERSSTVLRFFSKTLPPLIHIPHGAGDRAKSYDPRIRHFDHVLVAGEKDKRRMLELGVVTDENCKVTGYIKPYAVQKMPLEPFRAFKTPRPIVLYNPHFSKSLSSWRDFGEPLLEAFSENQDFNFIFAPHIRLAQRLKKPELQRLKAFEKFEHMHIDLGSARSSNMRYTQAANIYLGDVSSQVYEFLSRPKPCVFIGHSNVKWRDNPDYAHWRYGPVCHSVSEVMSALAAADKDLETYASAQIQGCLQAKGNPDWNPIARAACAVADILDAR